MASSGRGASQKVVAIPVLPPLVDLSWYRNDCLIVREMRASLGVSSCCFGTRSTGEGLTGAFRWATRLNSLPLSCLPKCEYKMVNHKLLAKR